MEYNVAGIWRRFGALIVDRLVFSVITTAISLPLILLKFNSVNQILTSGHVGNTILESALLGLFFSFILYPLYYIFLNPYGGAHLENGRLELKSFQ